MDRDERTGPLTHPQARGKMNEQMSQNTCFCPIVQFLERIEDWVVSESYKVAFIFRPVHYGFLSHELGKE